MLDANQRKAIVTGAAACFLLAAASQCGHSQPARPAEMIEVSREANGNAYRLVPGQRLIVRLPAKPGTGYSWNLAQPLLFMPLTGNTFTEPVIPGGEQLQALEFRADAIGEGQLTLQYIRPWESASPNAESFRIHVIVQHD